MTKSQTHILFPVLGAIATLLYLSIELQQKILEGLEEQPQAVPHKKLSEMTPGPPNCLIWEHLTDPKLREKMNRNDI